MIPVDKSMTAPGFGGVIEAEIILLRVILAPPDKATTICVAACWYVIGMLIWEFVTSWCVACHQR